MDKKTRPANQPPAPAGENQPAEGQQVNTLRVLWTVSAYVLLKSSTMTEVEARKMLFKPLDIGESWITFDGRTCRDIRFSRQTQNAKAYLQSRHAVSPELLDIRDETFDVYKTTCDLPGFDEYIRLKDRRLILHRSGTFFYFQSTVQY